MRITPYNTITIDVEDGINILMRDLFNIEMPPTNRVISNVNILLDLFAENDIKATFFILGEVASKFPSLAKNIASSGHEVGVHGYYHDQFFKLTPSRARDNLYRAKSLIEDITGNQVYGFRAPAFSILENTSWGLKIISELGFKYDSSIVPARGKRYGWPGFDKDILRFEFADGNTLIEVPISVINIFGRSIPVCGGGYLRYYPYSFTRRAFLKIQKHRPVIVYLHPYELDENRYPDFFYNAISTLIFLKRVPLYFYRFKKATVKRKLSKLTREFSFKTMIEIINDYEKNMHIPVRYL